jgi:hypothetical protein
VVPADKKWFTRLVVASALVEGLESLNLHYPRVDAVTRDELSKSRVLLAAELPEKKNGGKSKSKKDASG